MTLPGYDAWKLATPPEYEWGPGEEEAFEDAEWYERLIQSEPLEGDEDDFFGAGTMPNSEPLTAAVSRIAAEWEAQARITSEAATGAIIAVGGDMMLAEPWRITRAVYPFKPAIWPIPGMEPDDVLAECQRFIDAETERGVAGHWSYDGTRLIALRQAESALRRMI